MLDTLSELMARRVAAADADNRAGAGQIATFVQATTDDSTKTGSAEQGYIGERTANAIESYEDETS